MTDYKMILETLKYFDEKHDVTLLSNTSALLNEYMDNINWVGFYILDKDTLYLGPFQGKVACTEIKVGKGVCGTCIKNEDTILVENVHEFPGHIACDSASNSEICVPLYNKDNILYGLLDIDSPLLSRFNNEDKIALEEIAKEIGVRINGCN